MKWFNVVGGGGISRLRTHVTVSPGVSPVVSLECPGGSQVSPGDSQGFPRWLPVSVLVVPPVVPLECPGGSPDFLLYVLPCTTGYSRGMDWRVTGGIGQAENNNGLYKRR